MATQIANPIADRHFLVVGESGKTVAITFGQPFPDPDPTGDWICPFQIEGLDTPCTKNAHGLDALGALLNAIAGARHLLDASGLTLSWEGNEPGDTGIPRMVPTYLPRQFALEAERSIDEQIEAFSQPPRG